MAVSWSTTSTNLDQLVETLELNGLRQLSQPSLTGE
jgi:hypothetical protein